MYAIVEIAGQQFKVESGRKLYTNRLKGEEGASLSFDRVLLTDNDGQVNVGSPVVEGAKV
jgi:large subunit ribosomal protein L21